MSLAEQAVQAARSWIGTPYQHQASAKAAGTDCLGLLRGVWRELYGAEPEPVPAYTPDWAEPEGRELLWAAARRWLVEVGPGLPVPGDVLLFRMRAGSPSIWVLRRAGGRRRASFMPMPGMRWSKAR